MNGNRVVVTEEYSIINLRYEYPGFVGSEKYAVVTDLSKEALEKLYGTELKPYVPFVVLTKTEAAAFSDFNRNEDKFEKRQQLYSDAYGYEEGTTEVCYGELVQDNLFDIVSGNLDKERLVTALVKLSEAQKRRIEMYYLEGYTAQEIADIEGVRLYAVQKSIQAGLKILKRLLDEE
jgi:hypothetical protein